MNLSPSLPLSRRFAPWLLGAAGLVVACAVFAFQRLAPETWRAEPVALTYFEPHAGGCAWYRHVIGAEERETLTVFPTDCVRPRVAFSPGLERALVAFDGDLDGRSMDLLIFDVDLRRHGRVRLPSPPATEGLALAFDTSGMPWAFVLDQNFQLDEPTPSGVSLHLEYRGHRYPRSAHPEGLDALAHAWRYDGAAWRREETVATKCCEIGAPGVSALATAKRLAADPALRRLAAEAKRLPADAEGRQKLAALPDFPFAATDALTQSAAADYVLLSEASGAGGVGMRAYVFDRGQGRKALFLPQAVGARFWPVKSTASPL